VFLTATSITQLPTTASDIISFASNNRIFLFYGEMGAGKTTLIKSLCKYLGSNDNITSPTFAIVNEYTGKNGSIYHFDFYRLKTQTEALDIGFEEYLYSGNYCFIEWPEKIPDLLPNKYISIKIEALDNNLRQITVSSHL
jgi:tRNA threonylcarbamoyladenosine biosynthesis protein TsaE